jgi:predicted TPR repeat methyltransferase
MVFLKVLASMRVERMLDLGCGMGKYGRMVKDWCPGSERTGVDIVGEYLTRFALNEVYQRFVACDI